MPVTGKPQHHPLGHQLLDQVRTHFAAAGEDEDPPLSALLAHEDRANLDLAALAWVVVESAVQLLACTRTPVMAGDPNAEHYLQALDRLPRHARAGLLAAAVRRTTPHGTPSPATARVPGPIDQPAVRRRTPGPCPCPCNSGGFCGGCGHAGCGRRL